MLGGVFLFIVLVGTNSDWLLLAVFCHSAPLTLNGCFAPDNGHRITKRLKVKDQPPAVIQS